MYTDSTIKLDKENETSQPSVAWPLKELQASMSLSPLTPPPELPAVAENSVESPGDGTIVLDDSGDEDLEKQVMDYEERRLQTIKQNQELLASLGLDRIPALPGPSSPKKPRLTLTKRRAKPLKDVEPTRRSGRIKAIKEDAKVDPQVFDLPDDDDLGKKKNLKSEPELPRGKRIEVPSVRYTDDAGSKRKRQAASPTDGNSVEEDDYTVLYPKPTRRDDGTNRLLFPGRFNGIFEPNVTPEEMLKGGAFAGGYFKDDYSNVLKKSLPAKEDLDLLPASYTEPSAGFSVETHLTSAARDPQVNRFGRLAGQGLQEWEKSGWIWKGDPRGWMQWYLRFYEGRRCEDDTRQVMRWLNLAGPRGRFSRGLMKKIAASPGSGGAIEGNTAVTNEDVGTVMRQVCWQWGWECTEAEWTKRIAEGNMN